MPEAKKEKAETEQDRPNFSGLYRSESNKVIAGIAGGLGEYFNFDPTIIRVLFILLTIFGGSGLLIYIVLWLVLPAHSTVLKNSSDTIRSNIEEMKSTTRTFAHSIRRPDGNRENSKFWWAIIIIILGFFFLLNNFGLLEPLNLDKFWPLLLIIFGLAIILRK